jgi:hypothetical protein
MKHVFTSLVLLVLFSSWSFGQPRRPSPTGKAGYPIEKVDAGGEPDPLADFPTKGLPEAHLFGDAASPELAKKAAAAILKNDENSLPALIGALQKAGFHLIDKDQKILFQPTGISNGAAFFDYEVAGMLRATQFGAVTTLEKMAGMLTGNDPQLKSLRLASLFLSDLRAASTLTRERIEKAPREERASTQQKAFLAALVLELGAQTGGLTTTSSRINLIQASIIERRFLGDLAATYSEFQSRQAFVIRPFNPQNRMLDSRDGVRFVNVSWSRPFQDPCKAIETIDKIQGYESKGRKVIKAFDRVMNTLATGEYTEDVPGGILKKLPESNQFKKMFEERFKTVADGFEKLNIVMSYVKLVAANMSIKADLQVEDPMPLIRTKSNRNPGQERIVTAKFSIEFAGSEEINCTAKAAKLMTGLEVEVPDDGPLKDVPVIWEMLVEGDRYSRHAGYPVIVDAVDKTRGDTSRQRTNELGENKIKLTGKPQARNLEQEPVVPLGTKADLRVSIATEKMDAGKDIPKIFSFGLGGKFGPAALIEIAPEILGKMALRSFRVSVPVRDWQPCSEDWGGIITVHRELHKTVSELRKIEINGNTSGTGLLRVSEIDDAEIILNPRTPAELENNAPEKPASVTVRGVHSSIGEFIRAGDPCCGTEAGIFHTKLRRGEEFKYEKSKLTMSSPVTFRGSQRDYTLMLLFQLDLIPVEVRKFGEVLESNCPLEGGWSKMEQSAWGYTVTLPEGRWAERYVNPEGDVLAGSKTINAPDGAKVTWTWKLARCRF